MLLTRFLFPISAFIKKYFLKFNSLSMVYRFYLKIFLRKGCLFNPDLLLLHRLRKMLCRQNVFPNF